MTGQHHGRVLAPQGQLARSMRGSFVSAVVIGAIVAFIFGISFITVAVVAVVAAVAVTWRRLWSAVGWRPGQLHIPSSDLRLGQRAVVTYHRRARRRTLAGGTIHITLVCQEQTVSGSGTDRKTITETVSQRRFSAPSKGPDLDASLHIEVPLDRGGPSFAIGSNEINWWFDVEVSGEQTPIDVERFPVVVVPDIDPEAVAGASPPPPTPPGEVWPRPPSPGIPGDSSVGPLSPDPVEPWPRPPRPSNFGDDDPSGGGRR